VSVPPALADWTALLRTTVQRVTVASSPRELANIEAALANIAGLITPDPHILSDMDHVRAQVRPLRELLAAMPTSGELELAKAHVNGAIIVLEEGLTRARPNDVSRAIGHDW
jgi:hypothetical protein